MYGNLDREALNLCLADSLCSANRLQLIAAAGQNPKQNQPPFSWVLQIGTQLVALHDHSLPCRCPEIGITVDLVRSRVFLRQASTLTFFFVPK